MDIRRNVKSGQEQAIAAWINYRNQSRLDTLMKGLQREQTNLEEASNIIRNTLRVIERDIVNNGKGRGGQKGMHGFIAEVAECGIGNARSQIQGKAPIYEWINDNGPEDLKRLGIPIQQKFVQTGNHLSLQAIQKHLSAYPDFVRNGGVYQIPEDHYKKICWLIHIPESQANKMATSNGDFSLRQWREVHDFFEKGIIPFDSIFAGAVVEGGMSLCVNIRSKCKGKKLCELSEKDWLDIAKRSSGDFSKGGIRGASIYLLTNYTATPAAVANALTTASFGMAEQAHLLRVGKLTEEKFIENSEMICLDAGVSALSSFAGQVFIPIPILGAVIGNSIGVMMYQIAKDNLSMREQRLLKNYLESIQRLNASLDKKYKAYINNIAEDMETFMKIIEKAFVMDVNEAFEGSVKLAKACGVSSEEILDNRRKILEYFTK